MRLSKSKYNKILFLILALLSVAVFAICYFNSAHFDYEGTLHFAGIDIGVQNFNGILQAILFGLLILEVLCDYKKGIIFGNIVLAIQMVGSLTPLIKQHIFTSLPGTVNCVVMAIVLFVVYKQFRQSEIAELTDRVTGLYNRYGFEDSIRQNIRAWSKGYVAYIHLDGFLIVNANLGREYGDQVLKIVAERISNVVKDKGEVFKIEGAEYALIIKEDKDSIELANEIIDTVEEKIVLFRHDNPINIYVSAHVGIADCKYGELDGTILMKYADIALNHSMRSKDNKICVFDEDIHATAESQLKLESTIKEALENDYFYLVYQPQFVIADHGLRGFETLIRMKLPDGTIVSPAEFIEVAEQSDLIVAIDEFVIRRAMEEFRDIVIAAGKSFVVSVNVSAKEIGAVGFAQKILDLIEEYEFPCSCLEIEITEYSISRSIIHTEENIKILRENGVHVALDDFGTGYTSLSQLLNLPVDLLKIDKSLVDNIKDSELNQDFVKAIIYMGHLMGCDVIAEGIEDEVQLEIMNELKCDFVQGFVWGRPEKFEKTLTYCDVED